MSRLELDLRQARLTAESVTLTTITLMGRTEIIVPAALSVDLGGFALMGANRQEGPAAPPPSEVPLLRLRAITVMGATEVTVVARLQESSVVRDKFGASESGH